MSAAPDAPSRIPLEGAAAAPVLYFDAVALFGVAGGIGRICLETIVQHDGGGGQSGFNRRVVLHLAGNEAALQSLREALDGIALLSAQVNGQRN